VLGAGVRGLGRDVGLAAAAGGLGSGLAVGLTVGWR